MRPPVAAGPMSRKCRASKGERPVCACERTGVNVAAAASRIIAVRTATWRTLRMNEPPDGLLVVVVLHRLPELEVLISDEWVEFERERLWQPLNANQLLHV